MLDNGTFGHKIALQSLILLLVSHCSVEGAKLTINLTDSNVTDNLPLAGWELSTADNAS